MKRLLVIGHIFINLENVNTIEFKEETIPDEYRTDIKTGKWVMEVHCTNKTISRFWCTKEEMESYKRILMEYTND